MLSFFKSAALGAVALFVIPTLGSAAVVSVTFQQGIDNALTGTYEGTQDNWLYKGTSGTDNNYGSSGTLTARGGNVSVFVLRFDVSALKDQGDIQSATLTLSERKSSSKPHDYIDFAVYQITDANAAWKPGSSAGTVETGASSWNHLSYAAISPVNWAGGAGLSTSTTDPLDSSADYVVDAQGQGLATGTYDNTAANGKTIDLNIPASLIEYWIANPAKNAGLLIKTDSTTSGDFLVFGSSENTEAPGEGDAKFAWRPALTITYAQVPEPAGGAMVLLGMGLAGLRRRRRHVEC